MDVDRGASAPLNSALHTHDPSGTAGRIPLPRSAERGLPRGCALRPMGPEDLDYVVAEHLTHFPDGFFARLGSRFMTAYTRTYLTSPHARAYIAEADGLPVGFLAGVIDPAAHRQHVVAAHGRRLALRACAALAVRPGLTLHFLRTRLGRYAVKLLPGRRRPAPEATVAAPREGITAVLSHVAVTTRTRSRGLGSALIGRFAEDAAASGCARVSLVTATGSDGAGHYYERLGWQPAGQTRTPEGRTLTTYEYPLLHQHRGPAL